MMFQMDSSWVSGHQSRRWVPWMPIVGHGEQEQEVRELEAGLRLGERPKSVESWFEMRGLVPPNYTSEIPGEWDSLVVGAISSDYQKTRIERMAHRLGVSIHTQLWHHDSSPTGDLVAHGFSLKITSVSSGGLREVGRPGDRREVLGGTDCAFGFHRFHVDGEGGNTRRSCSTDLASDTQSTS